MRNTRRNGDVAKGERLYPGGKGTGQAAGAEGLWIVEMRHRTLSVSVISCTIRQSFHRVKLNIYGPNGGGAMAEKTADTVRKNLGIMNREQGMSNGEVKKGLSCLLHSIFLVRYSIFKSLRFSLVPPPNALRSFMVKRLGSINNARHASAWGNTPLFVSRARRAGRPVCPTLSCGLNVRNPGYRSGYNAFFSTSSPST